MVHALQIGTQAAMTAENLLVNNCRNGQTIEAVRKGFPQFNVVPALAFVVEAINAIYACTLMITAQQEEILRVFDFVGEQQTNCLERLLSAVHVVAEKQVIRFGREASVLKETQQIGELAVNVAAYLEWSLELQQNRLLQENLPRLETQTAHLVFRHVHWLSRTTAPRLQ